MASLRTLPLRIRPSLPITTSAPSRAFTTSSPLSVAPKYIPRSTPSKFKRMPPRFLRKADSKIPPYPYPESHYKPANHGLYGGQAVHHGNNVGPKFNTKTRRVWKPNAQWKRLYSVALGQFIRIHVTTRVMRTIDKCGGLDRYLLGDTPARIKELGPYGWLLRMRVMRTEWGMDWMRAERRRLGVPEDGLPLIGNSLRWVELPPRTPGGPPVRRVLPVGDRGERMGKPVEAGEEPETVEIDRAVVDKDVVDEAVFDQIFAEQHGTLEGKQSSSATLAGAETNSQKQNRAEL